MGNPHDAFRLFTTEDENEADTLAKELEKINRGRRAAAGAITRAVHERLALRTSAIPSVIALGDPTWRPSLLGLVANTVAEEYERPVFLWGREATMILKGSCRAGRKDAHVVNIMTATRDTFIEFGGHAQSGGFSVHEDTVFFLEEHLSKAQDALPKAPTDELLGVADLEITPEEATTELLSRLGRLAPFGMKNPKPIVLLRDVELSEILRFGKSEEHLKLRIVRESGTPLEAVIFYAKRELGKKGESLTKGARVSIIGNLERDTFTKGQPARLRLISVC
jgi:single-stranded-DNA-specific exonuclease